MAALAATVITPQEIQFVKQRQQENRHAELEEVLEPYLIQDIVDIIAEYAIPQCYECNPHPHTKGSECGYVPIAECAICKVGLCRYQCEERGLRFSMKDETPYFLSLCEQCHKRRQINLEIITHHHH